MHPKGVSLIEVVITLLLLSTTALMMANAFMTGGKIGLRNEELVTAIGFSRELVEEAKAVPFGGAVVPALLPAGFEKYNRTIKTEFVLEDNFNEVSPIETGFMKITAAVSAPNIKDVIFTTVINREISPSD